MKVNPSYAVLFKIYGVLNKERLPNTIFLTGIHLPKSLTPDTSFYCIIVYFVLTKQISLRYFINTRTEEHPLYYRIGLNPDFIELHVREE